ncbi:MAG: AI-2E family transporter [Planctomycetaceae bacterium]|nr:AI-2E family transporter [Planctomycetaceae bacterium]
MARIVSLVVLLVILVLLGGLFVRVMAGFLLPLFLAVLLAVVFGPLNRWFRRRLGKHDRLAALLSTTCILLLVLIPSLLLLLGAGHEAQALYRTTIEGKAPAAPATHEPAEQSLSSDAARLADWATQRLGHIAGRVGIAVDASELKASIGGGIQRLVAPLALRTTQFLAETLLGLFVMLLATYYFFADGDQMISELMRLTPLEGNRTQQLVGQFGDLTRAIVVATLVSAVSQGLLAGGGYYLAGVDSLVLLTALTMLFTLVPVVGSAIIWAPICLWLLAVEGRTTAAVLLAIYCIVVVSMVDNVVKPWILRGRSNLHPLLALLSILGGVEALGPIGIFVGPMVVAFLQTLLNMVHAELIGLTRNEAS